MSAQDKREARNSNVLNTAKEAALDEQGNRASGSVEVTASIVVKDNNRSTTTTNTNEASVALDRDCASGGSSCAARDSDVLTTAESEANKVHGGKANKRVRVTSSLVVEDDDTTDSHSAAVGLATTHERTKNEDADGSEE